MFNRSFYPRSFDIQTFRDIYSNWNVGRNVKNQTSRVHDRESLFMLLHYSTDETVAFLFPSNIFVSVTSSHVRVDTREE